MIVCKVVGHVSATKKEKALEGIKLMVVRAAAGDDFVAADLVGAGIGEEVLVVSGSTARRAVGRENSPVDAAIVGIIDTLEMSREAGAPAEQPKPKPKPGPKAGKQ